MPSKTPKFNSSSMRICLISNSSRRNTRPSGHFDLDDHSFRNTPLAEVDAFVEYLDSYRPSLQVDIQNLTALLLPLIEDQFLPDQRLKLEMFTESQIASG